MEEVEETDKRIIKQKQEFDALLKTYLQEAKMREYKKNDQQRVVEKQLQRESKIQSIKDRKFEEDLMNQQKSLNFKRNA